jgi:hypothetical protein
VETGQWSGPDFLRLYEDQGQKVAPRPEGAFQRGSARGDSAGRPVVQPYFMKHKSFHLGKRFQLDEA